VLADIYIHFASSFTSQSLSLSHIFPPPSNAPQSSQTSISTQKYGNIPLARDCWSRAFTVDPLNAYVCHAFSSLEKRLRNFERAKEILRDVVQKKPTATICISLSELERQLGDPNKAKAILVEALEKCTFERSKMLLSLAWLEEDAFGDVARARELIEEATAADMYNVRIHIARASLGASTCCILMRSSILIYCALIHYFHRSVFLYSCSVESVILFLATLSLLCFACSTLLYFAVVQCPQIQSCLM
jgi:tetratricopeptide (TPR) repeat protein